MRIKRRKMKNLRPIKKLISCGPDFQLTIKAYKNMSEALTTEEREKFYKEAELLLKKN